MTTTDRPATRALPAGWWADGLHPGEPRDVAPAWARYVEAALTHAGPAAAPEPAAGSAALAPALAPFVAAALAGPAVPGAVPAAVLRDALAAALRVRLARTAARTLVLELHRARDRGELTAADPQARFRQFVEHTATAAGTADLVTRYPVLARLLGQACEQESRALAELAARFTADRAAVVEHVLGGVDPGAVTRVDTGTGDRHGGGRAVAVLGFADGTRLAYKPRPVTLHHRFAELLAVLDAAAPGLAPRAPRALERDGHGWVEFVPRRPCGTGTEVARFYRRQGALLALLHALDATDAHCENVIACGDQPVLIDVETLLHPTPYRAGPVGDDPAMRAIAASVQRTALLPRPALGEFGALDQSGLGGEAALTPDAVARFADAGTDRMRLVREPVRYAGGESGPTLRGEAVDPRRHVEDLLAGFRTAYGIIAAAAPALLAPDGPLGRCGPETTRFVVRDTADYGHLLDETTHPDLLRSVADRDRVLTGFLRDDPPAAELVGSELADLWDGDVPLFTVRPDGRDVRSARGEVFPGLLGEPVLERVGRKIASMGAADLERQVWMVRATLALADGPTGHLSTAGTRRTGCAPAGPDRLLAAACDLGDQVVALAERDGHRVNWVGLQEVDRRFWTVLPLGAGLGDGYCGVALFLAQLGSVTGIRRYTDLARRAVTPLPWLLATLADPERAAAVGCGAFSGVGGITYTLARLTGLLGGDDGGAAELLPVAIAATLAAAGPADGPSDLPVDLSVDTGLAGGAVALHAVHAGTGLGAAEAAELAGRLAARTRDGHTGPAGFRHGADGVSWALHRTGHATHPAPAAAADAGPGWCSGSAGALLAASDTGRAAGSALVAATATRTPLAEHSLCHGEAGVLDALLGLDDRHPGAALRHDRAAQWLAALADGGPRCSTPGGLPAPGLLTGLSGVGYTLLRLARPAEVPSVLALRPSPGRPAAGPTTTTRPGPDARAVLDFRFRPQAVEER